MKQNQFTAAAAEEPTPADSSVPYSLSMCVLWYAYLKHVGQEIPKTGLNPTPWVHPRFKRFLMRKGCDPSGPLVQLLSGWKGGNTKMSFI